MDEKSRVAMVTGGSAGIGRATALAFARRGDRVVVADVDDARGERVAGEIEELGSEGMFVHADVAQIDDVEHLVATTVDRFGRLDFAFNNAGIEGVPAPITEATTEQWDRTIAVNLTGVWSCMRAELRQMTEQGSGSIVNCSSVAGLVGFPGIAPYVASKHGVVGLTKAVALECATTGIRVNAVCPGVIDTEMVERFVAATPGSGEALLASEPMGRMGTSDEIASAVLWLCSDGAGFVTGHALAVDGGFVSR
jgi:NAD(P)-dependent dehydrogenase (short-subunit alcohol dehydrogenase family)